MNYILDRLKERTTWAGIFSILAAFGLHFGTGAIDGITALGILIASTVLSGATGDYLTQRLSERSTWIGIFTILAGFGVHIGGIVQDAISTIGIDCVGLLLAASKDQYLIDRLKERTTWSGVLTIATTLGAHLSPENREEIVTAGVSIAGFLFSATPDKPA